MTKSIKMTALTLTVALGLAAYGALAQENQTKSDRTDAPAPGSMMAPGMMQGDMPGMMGMMNMMLQMSQMMETCNTMMQTAMQSGTGAPGSAAKPGSQTR